MVDINIKLSTEPVFRYFEEISKIPRCSGNEKAISDYLVAFAKSKNLEVEQDDAQNVLIKKPATPGHEKTPTVILQGHMDMVCDKKKSVKHDFKKDPIELRVKGDMLYAKDTTLGADDGIAIAYALALLDLNTIPHSPLKILITTEEEVGLIGASALDPKYLEGDMLINMDCEEEGILFSSCAGGIRVKHCIPTKWENPEKNCISYLISIRELKGGHSGVEIDKGRGNSNKLMGRFLNDLLQEVEYCISEINGGVKMNAIPQEADVTILIDPCDESKLAAKVDEWNSIFKNELKVSDPQVNLSARRLDNTDLKVLSRDTMKKVIALLVLIPNGVQTMSRDIEGLVESSTNLGVVTTSDAGILFESNIRSNIKSLKYNILNQAKMIANILDIGFETDSDYPEWEYSPYSKLRNIFKRVYTNMYNNELKVAAIHAGLECGLFKEKNKNLDMVAFGPNMYDVHTPNEHISISSIERTWEYLLAVLREIKPA
jgi:dipeptidase D